MFHVVTIWPVFTALQRFSFFLMYFLLSWFSLDQDWDCNLKPLHTNTHWNTHTTFDSLVLLSQPNTCSIIPCSRKELLFSGLSLSLHLGHTHTYTQSFSQCVLAGSRVVEHCFHWAAGTHKETVKGNDLITHDSGCKQGSVGNRSSGVSLGGVGPTRVGIREQWFVLCPLQTGPLLCTSE